MSKSLLRQLEDENAELSRSNASLRQEINALKKILAQHEKAIVALSAEISVKKEAELQLRHELQLQQASKLALERSNGELKNELRIVTRESADRARECERLAAAAAKTTEENAVARVAAEELQTAVKARDVAMHYEAARGAALESGVDALSIRLRAAEVASEARVGEWLAERRRLVEELRRAREANEVLEKTYQAQLARATKLKERLDGITQSLRACPPRKANEKEVD